MGLLRGGLEPVDMVIQLGRAEDGRYDEAEGHCCG